MKLFEHTLNTPKEFKRDIVIRVAIPEKAMDKHIPLMVVHDAQNFFDLWEDPTKRAKLVPILDTMFEQGLPHIALVGIDTWGDRTKLDRFTDFSPWESKDILNYIPSYTDVIVESAGGRGDLYSDFVINNIIPFVESNYKVGGSADMRGMLGHSMSSMASIYIGTKYNEYFSRFGFMSPALWCFKKEFKEYLQDIPAFKSTDRIYMDIGKNETSDPTYTDFPREYLEGADYIFNILKEKCDNIMYYIDGKGEHDMTSVNRHLPALLNFLWKN